VHQNFKKDAKEEQQSQKNKQKTGKTSQETEKNAVYAEFWR